jgi:hypothetical protein
MRRVLARLMGRTETELEAAFERATRGDLPSLLALRAQVLGAQLTWDDEAYLRWRYFDRLETAPDNHLWVFRDRSGEVLGCLGVEAVELQVGGELVPAHRYMDVMVQPRWNGLGLGAWMNLVLQGRYPVGFVVGATRDSYNLIRRVFHILPERHSWKLLVRSEDYLRRTTPRLARVPGAALVANSALGLWRRGFNLRRSAGVQIEPLTSPVIEEAAISALDRSMASTGLTFERRTAAYLDWRYRTNPRRQYRFWAARREGQLRGLLITRAVEDRGELVDWLWDATAPEQDRLELLTALFLHGIAHLAPTGVTMAWTRTLDPFSEQIAARAGMRLRPDRDTVGVYAHSPARQEQLASARWFLTLGDSDDD